MLHDKLELVSVFERHGVNSLSVTLWIGSRSATAILVRSQMDDDPQYVPRAVEHLISKFGGLEARRLSAAEEYITYRMYAAMKDFPRESLPVASVGDPA